MSCERFGASACDPTPLFLVCDGSSGDARHWQRNFHYFRNDNHTFDHALSRLPLDDGIEAIPLMSALPSHYESLGPYPEYIHYIVILDLLI